MEGLRFENSVAALLANRVVQLHRLRDGHDEVGFRDQDGELVRIDATVFQRQLTESLEKAFTRPEHWGVYTEKWGRRA